MKTRIYKIIIDIRNVFKFTNKIEVVEAWLLRLLDEQLYTGNRLDPTMTKTVQDLYMTDEDGYMHMLDKFIYDVISSVIKGGNVEAVDIQINMKVKVALITLIVN